MRKILLSLFFIALILQFGCKEKSVTYADSGSKLDLKVGQILNIELPGNPSTGNSWREIIFDEQLIQKDDELSFKPKDERIGSAGSYHFKFKAIAPGKTNLFMEYGAKYDSSKEALKTFELELIVEE